MTTQTISNSKPIEATSADWEKIFAVLPGEKVRQSAERLRQHFDLFEVLEDTVLPPRGMYVVLDGIVKLRQNDVDLATADTGDYFYEEHLEIRDIPVSLQAVALPGTRLAFLASNEWLDIPTEIRRECYATLFGDLVSVHLQNFQQPINCCSVTAAALSMSALGFSCEVNDIFRVCELPTSFVVNDGISLGELFDVACTYIHSQGLRDLVQVQA